MKTRLSHLTAMLFALTFSVSVNAQGIDFNRDIRPILSGKCFKCHGPDAEARQADLRLDQRASAVDVDAIIPGSPGESLSLIHI